MKDIATILTDAIHAQGWSISEAAKKIGVNRSFLNRLLRGGHPPTLRKGPRTAAGTDDRYQKIAIALHLDKGSFLELIHEQQEEERRSKKSPSKRRPSPTQGNADPLFTPDFIQRHADLYPIVAQNQPLQGESCFFQILQAAIDSLLPGLEARQWELRLLGPEDRRQPHTFSLTEHDHLGSRFHSGPSNARQEDAKTCLRLAERLTDFEIGDVAHNLNSRKAQVAIASLFYELAFLLASRGTRARPIP